MSRPASRGLTTTVQLLLSRWYAALASPRGIEVRVIGTSPRSMAANLNAARRKACDPALAELTIVFPAHPTDVLWIIPKGTTYEQPAPERQDHEA